MREKQHERIERAKQVEIKDLSEVREGNYRAELINDKGEERIVLLTPSKVMSSSRDMMYNGENYVGKYLLAGAMENDEFAEELYMGIISLETQVEMDIETVEEREDLKKAKSLTKDSKVKSSINDRLEELRDKVPEYVDRSDLRESEKHLELAKRFVEEQLVIKAQIKSEKIAKI